MEVIFTTLSRGKLPIEEMRLNFCENGWEGLMIDRTIDLDNYLLPIVSMLHIYDAEFMQEFVEAVV